MKLRDIVADINIQSEGGRIGDILADLDTEDRELLREMLDSQTASGRYKYPARTVSRALTAMDHPISERSIQRYRQDKRESQ